MQNYIRRPKEGARDKKVKWKKKKKLNSIDKMVKEVLLLQTTEKDQIKYGESVPLHNQMLGWGV